MFTPIATPGISSKGTPKLSVSWDNEKRRNYPAVWLRDNCQCEKCYSPSALARSVLMQNLDVNISIDSAKVIEDKVSAILSHQRVDNPIETFDQNINQLIMVLCCIVCSDDNNKLTERDVDNDITH